MDKETATMLIVLSFFLGMCFFYVLLSVVAPGAFISTAQEDTCVYAGFDAAVVDRHRNLLCVNYSDVEPYFVYYQPVIDEALGEDK